MSPSTGQARAAFNPPQTQRLYTNTPIEQQQQQPGSSAIPKAEQQRNTDIEPMHPPKPYQSTRKKQKPLYSPPSYLLFPGLQNQQASPSTLQTPWWIKQIRKTPIAEWLAELRIETHGKRRLMASLGNIGSCIHVPK